MKAAKTLILVLVTAAVILFGSPTAVLAVSSSPSVSSYYPEKNATSVSAVAQIRLIFNTGVAPGSGVFTIKQAGTDQVYDTITVPGSNVFCDNEAVTITLNNPIPEDGKTYYITADAGTFIETGSGMSVPWPGVSSSSEWTFTMANLHGLQPIAFTPSDGSTDVSVDIHPSLQFSVEIRLIDDECHMYQKDTNIEVPCSVSAQGDTLVFTPLEPLNYGTEYYILVDSNSVVDTQGNYFAGLVSQTDWTFTTGAMPMSTPTPTLRPEPTHAAQPTRETAQISTPTPELTPTPTPVAPTPTPAAPTPTSTPQTSLSAGLVQQFGLTDGTTYDLATLIMMAEQQRADELDAQTVEIGCLLKELLNQQKVLTNILSKLKSGTLLGEDDIDKLGELEIITDSERALCNDVSFKDTLIKRIETKLDELDASIQLNTVRLQHLIDKRNQACQTLVAIGTSTRDSIVGNMRSEPKYAMTDENGYMLFHDMEFGEHTFALFDENGEWIAGVRLRLENDTSRPASTEWVQEEDGTWVFNVSGNTAIAMFDIDLTEEADGSKTIVFTGGTAIGVPASPPVVWPYIAGGAVLLLGAAAFCILFYRKRKKKGLSLQQVNG